MEKKSKVLFCVQNHKLFHLMEYNEEEREAQR